MTNQSQPDKPTPSLPTRLIGWLLFVLAFVGAYLLVRRLLSK